MFLVGLGVYFNDDLKCNWSTVFIKDKVLLIKSERRGWEIPGGVIEPGEDILEGLKRELKIY